MTPKLPGGPSPSFHRSANKLETAAAPAEAALPDQPSLLNEKPLGFGPVLRIEDLCLRHWNQRTQNLILNPLVLESEGRMEGFRKRPLPVQPELERLQAFQPRKGIEIFPESLPVYIPGDLPNSPEDARGTAGVDETGQIILLGTSGE